MLVLPSGKVFQLGSNGNTAIYDPSTNSWTAGPQIPTFSTDGVRFGSDDAPAALTTDGEVLFTADRPSYNAPTDMFEYDPTANTITDITSTLPAALQSELNITKAYEGRLTALPNGQVLFEDAYNDAWVFTPGGATITAGGRRSRASPTMGRIATP